MAWLFQLLVITQHNVWRTTRNQDHKHTVNTSRGVSYDNRVLLSAFNLRLCYSVLSGVHDY